MMKKKDIQILMLLHQEDAVRYYAKWEETGESYLYEMYCESNAAKRACKLILEYTYK